MLVTYFIQSLFKILLFFCKFYFFQTKQLSFDIYCECYVNILYIYSFGGLVQCQIINENTDCLAH